MSVTDKQRKEWLLTGDLVPTGVSEEDIKLAAKLMIAAARAAVAVGMPSIVFGMLTIEEYDRAKKEQV